MSKLPHILVTPDIEKVTTSRGAQKDLFVLEAFYATAVLDAGGIAHVAPYTNDEKVLDALVEMADGLLLTGGDFDVDPALFNEAPHESLGTLKPRRTLFESALYARALEKDLPILGICGGMQLMCVKRGGTLFQDLGTQYKSEIVLPNMRAPHEQLAPKMQAGHDVAVIENTRLRKCLGCEHIGVNSTHHQAVKTLGEGLVASAIASDGIVEAFEDPAHKYFLGVQWHPEAMDDLTHRKIYEDFIEACRG